MEFWLCYKNIIISTYCYFYAASQRENVYEHFLMDYAFNVLSKNLSITLCQEDFLFSKSFIVLFLIFVSMTHFDFILCKVMRFRLRLSFFHMEYNCKIIC